MNFSIIKKISFNWNNYKWKWYIFSYSKLLPVRINKTSIKFKLGMYSRSSRRVFSLPLPFSLSFFLFLNVFPIEVRRQLSQFLPSFLVGLFGGSRSSLADFSTPFGRKMIFRWMLAANSRCCRQHHLIMLDDVFSSRSRHLFEFYKSKWPSFRSSCLSRHLSNFFYKIFL